MKTQAILKNTTISCLLIAFGFMTLSVFTSVKATPTEPRTETQITKLTTISDDDQQLITLPLRIFIISDLELEKKGVKMTTWLTPEDIEKNIVPEINRIWKPAGIQWVIESIITQPAAETKNRQQDITYIQNSKREPKEAKVKHYPLRTNKIRALCGKENQHPLIHNLYFFPYLGQTYQGFAAMRGNYAIVGSYTDKHNRGLKPPEKALLTEPQPMKRGSIARTSAHELGHNLGLIHPDKPTQKQFHRIMGGKKQGYSLTPEEIKIARKIALARANKILTSKP
ncbi:MAG: hypothetical protein ACSHX6_02025 [Akkermansiaceae bacterium]